MAVGRNQLGPKGSPNVCTSPFHNGICTSAQVRSVAASLHTVHHTGGQVGREDSQPGALGRHAEWTFDAVLEAVRDAECVRRQAWLPTPSNAGSGCKHALCVPGRTEKLRVGPVSATDADD